MRNRAKQIQKKQLKPRARRVSRGRIEAALQAEEFSPRTEEESGGGRSEAQADLTSKAEGIHAEETSVTWRHIGLSAGLTAAEVELVSQGRLDLLSIQALERIIAVTSNK